MVRLTNQHRGRQEPTTRFQRLWAEAETLAKDNAELEKGLGAIVKRINEDIFAAERHLAHRVVVVVQATVPE